MQWGCKRSFEVVKSNQYKVMQKKKKKWPEGETEKSICIFVQESTSLDLPNKKPT